MCGCRARLKVQLACQKGRATSRDLSPTMLKVSFEQTPVTCAILANLPCCRYTTDITYASATITACLCGCTSELNADNILSRFLVSAPTPPSPTLPFPLSTLHNSLVSSSALAPLWFVCVNYLQEGLYNPSCTRLLCMCADNIKRVLCHLTLQYSR